MSLFSGLLARPDPDAVVREHGPMVYRQLRRIFGPSADVDDVYQAVFVEVLRSLPGFLGRSRLSTWIRRITWNVAYQHMRLGYRAQLESYEENRHTDADAPDVEADHADRQALVHLYAALDELDAKQRIAVIMHDLEGYTLKEIAGSVGRPLQTVASQLHAGRARLTELVTERVAKRGTSARGSAEEKPGGLTHSKDLGSSAASGVGRGEERRRE